MAPTPIRAVAIRPKTFTQRGLVNRPMISLSLPILKMKNMSIGAVIPFRIAAQYSAVIGLMPMKLSSIPTNIEAMITQ
jgi:hypothetical protein